MFKFSEIFDGCVPSSLASHVCKPAPPVTLVQLVKMVSAESAMRPMSIFHESLALLNTTGASAHHRHENDTNVQSKGINSVGMVLVGAVLDVHSKKSWPPVCEKMLLNMPVMTMVRFAYTGEPCIVMELADTAVLSTEVLLTLSAVTSPSVHGRPLFTVTAYFYSNWWTRSGATLYGLRGSFGRGGCGSKPARTGWCM